MRKNSPPIAKVVPHELRKHGCVRIDNYFWLNQRDNPEVIDYLNAENQYLETVMKHTDTLQEKLFEEIVGRMKREDQSVPYFYDSYYYYHRFERDKEYAIYCRKKDSLDSPEEILIDGNHIAEGCDFFSLAGPAVSSGRNILAFGVDTVGRRFYDIRFKDLSTGEMLSDVIPNVTGNMAWAEDNRTLFYAKQDPETLRSDRIYRHLVGQDPGQDVLVYQEEDETFNCVVFKTKSRRFLLIGSEQTLSSEYRFLDAAKPGGDLTLILPREADHEYSVIHFEDKFLIRTNWEARNFRLMETPIHATAKENWRELVPHREDVYLDDCDVFRDFLVLTERKGGLNHIRIAPWNGSEAHDLDFEEPAYLAYLGANREIDTKVLRYVYSSMTTPNSTYDYDMVTRKKVLLKQDEIVGGYESSDYRAERLMVPARDGAEVPLSIVFPEYFKKDGSHPLLLYGYGSYGYSLDATFSSARLSLLERGFAFAIAHVRGGQELGRRWYEDGKLLEKKNTFNDFIDCAQHLVDRGYTSRDRLFAMGGSAGGLLMGAVINMAPENFKGVVANVPFIDVATTMLDPDIPLTTAEYDEWGDPNQKEFYDYIVSYSPYDNVQAKDYPHLLVTSGLHDSQVQYWEAAKWVAKLRALKTGDSRVLLRTNMEAGHGGPSGRFRRHRETALAYAFLLDLAGVDG